MNNRRSLRLVPVVLGLCCLVTAAPIQAQGNFIRGDVNGNGQVDGADTTKLIFHLFMGSPINCDDAADVNDDGIKNIADLTYLSGLLNFGSPLPPPPYPECGQDPTEDGLGCGVSTCVPAITCAVERTGDCNMDGVITSTDIIHEVNFVFKSGPHAQPCTAAGDVNCSATITSTDIIALVNYVFKSGEEPCDVCTLVPELWFCP